MQTFEFHPIAGLFPMMDEAAFAELVEDIAQHGLREPIILYEGKILDGRNRYRACAEAEIEPQFEDYEGDDAVGFVISLNLRRRHLNESQRGMVAAALGKLPRGSNQHSSIELPSTKEVAGRLNVGEATVKRSRFVQEHVSPKTPSCFTPKAGRCRSANGMHVRLIT